MGERETEMALGSSPARLAGKKAAIAIVVLGLFNVFLLFQITAGRNTLTTMQAQLDKLENSAHTRQSQYEHMVEIVATKVDTQQKEFTEFKDWIHKTSEMRKGLFNTQPAEGVVSTTSSTDMLRPLGGPNGLADRMSRLEAITKGRLNWIREPYVGHRVMHKCAHEEHLDEHYICYDHFPPPSERAEPCIVYDMGIREQPGFGKTLAEKYPQCQVHAFDPSPIAVAFQASDDETAKALRALPNYHFHPYGSGAFGDTELLLEVKTLKTIMKELGHTHVDVLKLDVEGSEFAFLESALDDFDCPPVEQMSIEWHHYNFDSRYGGGASPEMNAIATYLHDRCNVKQYQIAFESGGWEDNFEWLKDAYLQLRFNTGSYMRAR